MSCPEGTYCGAQGVSSPCILPGYWRYLPVNEYNAGADFISYPVYECEYEELCIGSCNGDYTTDNIVLYEPCSYKAMMDSPVCGICAPNYYLFNDNCYQCGQNSNVSVVGALLVLGTIYSAAIVISLYLIHCKAKLDDEEEVKRQNKNMHLYGRREITRTAKLVVSFMQVVIGVISLLHLDLRGILDATIGILYVDPFGIIFDALKCSGNEDGTIEHIVFVFWLVVIYFIVTALYSLRKVSKLCPTLMKSEGEISGGNWIREMNNDAKDVGIEKEQELMYKITNALLSQYLIVSFVIFPFFTKRFVLALLTRNLSPLGTYMRVDYGIDTKSYSFSVIKLHSVWGLLVLTLGTLVMLFTAVFNRKNPICDKASLILHQDFKRGWVYFEEFTMVYFYELLFHPPFPPSLFPPPYLLPFFFLFFLFFLFLFLFFFLFFFFLREYQFHLLIPPFSP